MINYPNKKNSFNETLKVYGNRGMGLEESINITNEYYLEKELAVIHKKPTPIQIVKIDYTNGARICDAYFKAPSTTDYNGIYKGKYIDFEAKETNSKTSFSLSNIHEHQIKHLIDVKRHGAISFIIVRFNLLDKTYLLKTEDLEEFIKNNKRKSIPNTFFETYGTIIKIKYAPRIDFLECIENIYFGGNNKL